MLDQLARLVGHTPMIALRYRYADGPEQEVLVKCEQYNLTGSIKDRVALYVLQKAKEQQKLLPGDVIVVASSGNCAASYAAIGKALGHRVKVILPETVSPLKRALAKSYGAEIHLAKSMEEAIQAAEAYTYLRCVFLPHRSEGLHQEVHELFTGREIGHDLLLQDLKPDAFVAGGGSGATLIGVGNYLRKLFPAVKLQPLTAKGQCIDGLSAAHSSEALRIDAAEAALMAQRLGNELKLEVGISSGANLLAAIRLQQSSPEQQVVVTIFPDDGKRYTGNGLLADEQPSPEISLTGYSVLNKK